MSRIVLSIQPCPLNRRLFGDFLRLKGLEIIETASPSEAIRILSEKKVNLIVSEFRLPDISGTNFALWVKSSEFKYLPLLAWTACAFKSEKEAMIEAGFDDVLVKSARLDDIWDFVRKYAFPPLRSAA